MCLKNGLNIRHQWNKVWYISSAVYALGGLVFELFGTAEPQPWAVARDESLRYTLNIQNSREI